MLPKDIIFLSESLGRKCLAEKIMLATAESCTGGLLAQNITGAQGSSEWFDRGVVTYSNQSKIDCLGVTDDILSRYGAVSQETANQMAQGALVNSLANLTIAITGIAGPSGGTKLKPTGTIFFSIAYDKKLKNKSLISTSISSKNIPNSIFFEHMAKFQGNRSEIREKALLFALNQLLVLTL